MALCSDLGHLPPLSLTQVTSTWAMSLSNNYFHTLMYDGCFVTEGVSCSLGSDGSNMVRLKLDKGLGLVYTLVPSVGGIVELYFKSEKVQYKFQQDHNQPIMNVVPQTTLFGRPVAGGGVVAASSLKEEIPLTHDELIQRMRDITSNIIDFSQLKKALAAGDTC